MEDKGFLDQVRGKVKETAGDVTGDKSMKAEGILEQVIGKAKEVTSDIKDAAEGLVDKAKYAIDSNKAEQGSFKRSSF